MRLRLLFLLYLSIPLLAGWGHWGPQVKVGFSVDNAQGREVLIKSLKDELEDNRADLLLKDAKGDPSAQEQQVKDLIAQGIQALIVLPVDPEKAAPLVQAAHQAGIKVIALDSMISGGGLDYLVAFNDEKAGELQAKAVVKKTPRGSYLLLGSNQGLREGQMKVLQPQIERGDIRIVASGVLDEPVTLKGAKKKIDSLLKEEGTQVNVVLAADNQLAAEAVQSMGMNGTPGKIQLAGIGEDLASCRRIASGTQALTIYHPPKKLAEEAAYLTAKVARNAKEFDCQFIDLDNGGGTTKAVLLTPVVVDAKNLDSTIIADGVQKKEEVYGKDGN